MLYRVNAQSETYEQALAAAGIPYLVRGGERFFERREVREAVTLLRGAARSTDSGETDGDDLPATVRHVFAAANWTPGTAVRYGRGPRALGVAERAGPARRGDGRGGPGSRALPSWSTELEQRQAAQHAPPVDGVTLASLHAAKGLEWDAVFLVGLADGTVPIVHAETAAQVEEERRLLYVGVTRAREHLWLSWALARSPGGARYRKPSRFLDGLLPRGSAPTSGSGASTGPAILAQAGRQRAPAGSAARCCRLRSSASSAAARTARPTATRSSSSGCASGAWRRRRSGRSRRSWSSPTRPCPRSRRPSRAPWPSWSRSRASGQRKLDDFGAAVLALVADAH